MKVDIKRVTRDLNVARLEAGDKVFKNHKEFKEYLKSCGLKVGYDYLSTKLYSAMCKDGRFLPNPIYIEKVASIYDEIKEHRRNYYKNEVIDEKSAILSAIELLKSKGYKILKPVTEYEEV